jgi:hypothetical protein
MQKLLVLLLCAVSTTTFGQKAKLKQGSLKPLFSETSLNYEFSYDSLIVGDTTSEKVFLEKRRKRFNDLNEGMGDGYVTEWYEARKSKYEPSFLYYFGKASGITKNSPDSKYTVIVKTMTTEPGWNFGVATSDGKVGGELLIVETKDRSKLIAKIVFSHRSDDVGVDAAFVNRLQQAYVNAAKLTGELVNQKSGR